MPIRLRTVTISLLSKKDNTSLFDGMCSHGCLTAVCLILVRSLLSVGRNSPGFGRLTKTIDWCIDVLSCDLAEMVAVGSKCHKEWERPGILK